MNGRRVIALTGAESTGKTTLANALAAALAVPLVTEAARDLLVPGEPYTLDDVIQIARAQFEQESAALSKTDGLVIADTDLLVIRIWLDERFQVWPDSLRELWQASAPRLRVLTPPESPWSPDPLRENPHDRDRLHHRYRDALAAIGEPWIEVGGCNESRLGQVLANVSASRSGECGNQGRLKR